MTTETVETVNEFPKESLLSTDPNEPGVRNGNKLLVLPLHERSKAVKKVRTMYRHLRCNTNTSMCLEQAETMACETGENFYLATVCKTCKNFFKIEEFVWADDNTPLLSVNRAQEAAKAEYTFKMMCMQIQHVWGNNAPPVLGPGPFKR